MSEQTAAPARPLNTAKITEFYSKLKASPPAFINELVTLLKVFGPLASVIPALAPFAGFIPELEAALQLFSATATAPLQNLDQSFAYLTKLGQ